MKFLDRFYCTDHEYWKTKDDDGVRICFACLKDVMIRQLNRDLLACLKEEASLQAYVNNNQMEWEVSKSKRDFLQIENNILRDEKAELQLKYDDLTNRSAVDDLAALGVIEVMVRNPQVDEYIKSLEARLESAEKRIVEILKTPW